MATQTVSNTVQAHLLFAQNHAQPRALAFLTAEPGVAAKLAKYEADPTYRFVIDTQDRPFSRQALPRELERQAFGPQTMFALDADQLATRHFGVQIVDPNLKYPEFEIIWSDAQLAEIANAPSWAIKSAAMKRLIVDDYTTRVAAGENPYLGVEIKLRLTGIMNTETREMTPQGGGKGQNLPDGEGWLLGHRTPTLKINPENFGGLFTEPEFRNLHHYASLMSLLRTIEGDNNAAYREGDNSTLRQYLSAARPNAQVQFQLDFRPKSQKPEDAGLYVPGLKDVKWEGFSVLGVFAGGASETPTGVVEIPTVDIEAPFPDFEVYSATPADEALATPAKAGVF
jgi:hypothetical protein